MRVLSLFIVFCLLIPPVLSIQEPEQSSNGIFRFIKNIFIKDMPSTVLPEQRVVLQQSWVVVNVSPASTPSNWKGIRIDYQYNTAQETVLQSSIKTIRWSLLRVTDGRYYNATPVPPREVEIPGVGYIPNPHAPPYVSPWVAGNYANEVDIDTHLAAENAFLHALGAQGTSYFPIVLLRDYASFASYEEGLQEYLITYEAFDRNNASSGVKTLSFTFNPVVNRCDALLEEMQGCDFRAGSYEEGYADGEDAVFRRGEYAYVVPYDAGSISCAETCGQYGVCIASYAGGDRADSCTGFADEDTLCVCIPRQI